MPEPTTPTPADNGGTAQPTPTGTPPAQPASIGQSPAAPSASAATSSAAAESTQSQPFKSFATEKELKTFVADEVTRTAAKLKSTAVRQLAKDYGFEDADELREWLGVQRQTPPGQGQNRLPATPDVTTPANAPAAASWDAARLHMALQVGAELNLPAALIARLHGDTLEAMKADAQTLVALMGTGTQRGPGIPPVPEGGQPVTITQTQLSDPKWVRKHEKEILQASAEGRIVRS